MIVIIENSPSSEFRSEDEFQIIIIITGLTRTHTHIVVSIFGLIYSLSFI